MHDKEMHHASLHVYMRWEGHRWDIIAIEETMREETKRERLNKIYPNDCQFLSRIDISISATLPFSLLIILLHI